jgi:hypothetical protein
MARWRALEQRRMERLAALPPAARVLRGQHRHWMMEELEAAKEAAALAGTAAPPPPAHAPEPGLKERAARRMRSVKRAAHSVATRASCVMC